MALPFVSFVIEGGRLFRGHGLPYIDFDTVLCARPGRLYCARFAAVVCAPFFTALRKKRVFIIPAGEAPSKNDIGRIMEAFLARLQAGLIDRMRADLGIGDDSYFSVMDGDVEVQFYFYPHKEGPEITRSIDTNKDLATIGDTMSSIKPTSDRVFLEPVEEDRTTKSGIVLPDSAEKERPVKGRVIAVGAGMLNDRGERNPMSVKVGDTVLFKKYGPDEIEIEGKKYLVAEENDILAIIEA
jgi:chaperonin GroES